MVNTDELVKEIVKADKMNIINGKLVEHSTDLESLNGFVERWEPKINEIKKCALNNEQANYVAQSFINEFGIKFHYKNSILGKLNIIKQLLTDLNLALEMAYSNYRKENKPFMRIFLEKLDLSILKDFNLIKLK